MHTVFFDMYYIKRILNIQYCTTLTNNKMVFIHSILF